MSPNLVEEVATLKKTVVEVLEILYEFFDDLGDLLGLSLISERRKIEELKESIKVGR